MTQSSHTSAGAAGTLRVLSAMLSYPDVGLRAQLAQAGALLRAEAALSPTMLAQLEALIARLREEDPFDVESDYVETFDRGRATSLHLFEHVHGDSRERGPAMVDLARTYEQAGLYLEEGELPDYLPVVLEYASTQPAREARDFLGEIAHLLGVIEGALQRRSSPYAGVLAALLELAGAQTTTDRSAAKYDTDETLDESWAEPPVFQGCSVQGQARPGQAQPIHFISPKAAQGTPRGSAGAAT